jgi:uncharacterized protein
MSEPANAQTVQRNVGVVQGTYQAVGRRDIPALLDLLAEDVEWTMQGTSKIPIAGTHRGHEGVVRFFTLVGENIDFQQFEPREFIAQGDTVVAIGFERNLIKPTGRTFEQEWVHVYTLEDGKVTRVRIFEDTVAFVFAFDAS